MLLPPCALPLTRGPELMPPPEALEPLLSEVQLTFHYLAQHELQNFCDLCRGTCARARAGIVAGRRSGPPRLHRQPRIPPLRTQWMAAHAK